MPGDDDSWGFVVYSVYETDWSLRKELTSPEWEKSPRKDWIQVRKDDNIERNPEFDIFQVASIGKPPQGAFAYLWFDMPSALPISSPDVVSVTDVDSGYHAPMIEGRQEYGKGCVFIRASDVAGFDALAEGVRANSPKNLGEALDSLKTVYQEIAKANPAVKVYDQPKFITFTCD